MINDLSVEEQYPADLESTDEKETNEIIKMTKKDKVEKPEQQNLAIPEQKTVVLQGDPVQQLEFAKKCSVALMDVLKLKPKKVMINGKQYIEYEDWQTLARFYGATVGTEWTKPIERNGKVWGYEAKAIVTMKGELVSSAEAMCTRDERNWAARDEFALRSMAQTRACAKSLRNVFAWIVVMAGLQPTPAEEMDNVAHDANLAADPGAGAIEHNKFDWDKRRWLKKLGDAATVDEATAVWKDIPIAIKRDPDVEMFKADLKSKFESQ